MRRLRSELRCSLDCFLCQLPFCLFISFCLLAAVEILFLVCFFFFMLFCCCCAHLLCILLTIVFVIKFDRKILFTLSGRCDGKREGYQEGRGEGVDLYDPLCWWWWPTWRQRNLRKPISTLRFAAYERSRCRRRAVAPLLPLGWHVCAFLLSLSPSLSLSLSCSLWWSLCDDCVGVPGGVWRGVQCGAKLDCVYKSNCIVLVAVAVVAVVAVVVVAWTLLFTQITSCCQLQQQQGQPLCRQALAKFCCTQLTHTHTQD